MRNYLIERGLPPRRFRSIVCPRGRGAGEQFVRERYTKEVKAHRSRAKRLNVALVAVIDADKHTVDERKQQLDGSLEADSQEKRKNEEKIAIYVPRRNIETWILWLRGEQVDEETDYKKRKPEFPGECKPQAKRLAQICSDERDFSILPSLEDACDESLRIL